MSAKLVLSFCSMFLSAPPYSDLIFQDATRQLRVIEPEKRSYEKYLGPDFMRARRIVDCHAGASVLHLPFSVISLCMILVLHR